MPDSKATVARAPYGTWTSPITAEVVAAQGLRLGYVAIDGDDIYWVEGRPHQGGRNVLVRFTPDGAVRDVTGEAINVRSRVHEYGGGAYAVSGGTAYVSNFADQRVYAVLPDEDVPRPLTPPGDWCYADYAVDPGHRRLICVREDHTDRSREPVNALVSIPIDGGQYAGDVLASGYDFYASPRLSRDGGRLAWICWRHPNMPWDGTELWVADIASDGSLSNQRRVAGGAEESVVYPGWAPDGRLYFASDISGWWHLYYVQPDAELTMVQVTGQPWLADAEFGGPLWQLGTSMWSFAGDSTIVATYTRKGRRRLSLVDPDGHEVRDLITRLDPADWVAATAEYALFVGGGPTVPQAVVKFFFATGIVEVLRSSSSIEIDRGYLSEPTAITYPTDGGVDAHAFYYPPTNKDVAGPADERPPLVVISHGGPTTAARATLDLVTQFWTSRGLAVVDVNYGGSTGFGRAYRERLDGQWGIVDVADCVNAALRLAADGLVDRRRLIVRGGSAGGYTALAALTFHPDVFTAAASYYGVSDVEVLAQDTHKFESRYTDTLIGPYPAALDVYRARSPIHFIDRLSCPVIFFQGLDDKVVPPNQTERMAEAVRAKGLPTALLLFEGEQHGFRRAETIVRCLEAELFFYGAVFGFAPADRLQPIEIANAPGA